MRFSRVTRHRLRSLFRRSRVDADLQREIELHIEQLTREAVASGLSEPEARAMAFREFGPIEKNKEECRDARRLNLIDDLRKDLHQGARMMWKKSGFSVIAILTLGLGIGANTAIFSAVDALLIRPLPYERANELVVPATVLRKHNTDRANLAYADYLDLKQQTQIFRAVAVHFERPADVTGQGYPERIKTSLVSEDYFRVMDARPILGRMFTHGESVSAKPDVAVLSYDYWMRRFGGDPGVLQRTLDISAVNERIIGVMPPHSTWPDATDVFLPLGLGDVPPAAVLKRDNFSIGGIARLRPGLTLAKAQSEVDVLAERIERDNPTLRAGTGFKLFPLSSWIIGPQMRQMLLVMMAAVALVLVIACANLANLLLVKGMGRGREFAIRTALGAGWPRLARQVLTEQAMIGCLGAIAGALLGFTGAHLLVHFAPAGTPRLDEIRPNSTVFLFTTLLSTLTTVIFAMLPALQAAKSKPTAALRDGGRSVSGGVGGSKLRALLVLSQMALSMVLLVGAGLLMQTFINLTRINVGFQPHGLTTFELALPDSRYASPQRTSAAVSRMDEAIRHVPGVLSAGVTSALPAGGGGFYLGKSFMAPNRNRDAVPGAWDVISPGYFDVLGARILAGRGFTSHDNAAAPPVIILSRSLAQKLFPHENPIGKQVRPAHDEPFDRQVVGVTEDVPYFALVDTQSDVAYVPHAQQSWNTMEFVVRSRLGSRLLLPTIKAAVAGQDSQIALAEVQTMDDVLDKALGRPRFLMLLLSIFAGVAVVLAAIGVYGVLSYFVSERAREIGIRLAIGAQPSSIFHLVAFRGMLLAICGVAIGAAVALAAARAISGLLFGITAHDPVTFASAALVLLVVTFLGSAAPVSRALRVDPIQTLRYE